MRNGKAEIEEVIDETGDFSFVPTPDAFEVSPTPVRRSLTSRDVEHNQQVSKFFNTVIPGLPIDRDAPQLRPPVIPFSEIMEAALKKLDIHVSPFIDDLAENWASIVPPAIAKLTRPGKWENNILYVYVPSSTHLFELRRTALHQIEEAVRAFAGTTLVRQVRLMVEVKENK